MKKLSILTLTMIALSSFMAITVWAASPHFLRCAASGVNPDGTLNVSFTIAGLGDNQSLTVTASADANATYGCLNHGQQCPNAANKVNVQTDVSATGTFPSGKNGQVTACLTVEVSGRVTAQGTFTSGKNGSIRGSLTVDPPPTTLNCPGGQTLVLVSVSYTNVSVSAPGAGDCNTSPGTFAANFFPQCP
jgi:hypothetical protein